MSATFRRWINEWEVVRRSRWNPISYMTPPQIFAGSFFLLVVVGTVGLKVLPGLYVGEELNWLDALFTSTSAVCVTGLIVVDTATYFTWAGQAFILLLIQLGGLGIITFSTLLIMALGRRLSLHHESLNVSLTDVAPHVKPEVLIRDVVRFTFVIEAVGALLLYVLWIPRFGFGGAVWPAMFHSISAFCNAGFSTYSNSLMDFQGAPLTLLLVMLLIVTGGIGFLTMEELKLKWKHWRLRRSGRRQQQVILSFHSRLALGMTALALVGGWVLFSLFEWNGVLAGQSPVLKSINALFLSVTPRTAGFNTIDYTQATESTNFFTVVLMFVGGSPGSTAGGLKTTTIAIILLVAVSRLRGMRVAGALGRSVPEDTTQRAAGLVTLAAALVTAAIFILTAVDLDNALQHLPTDSFLATVFEVASAFNTVGLSMGVTPELNPVGRVVVIVLMFLGRVGPLTFATALALSDRTGRGKFRYAYEDVIVG